MNAQETIAAFLRGKMDIISFRRLYDESPEIDDFLQGIVDEVRRTNAPTAYHWETRKDGVKVHSRSVVDDLLRRDMDIYQRFPEMIPRFGTVREALMKPGDVRYSRNALQFYSRVHDVYLQHAPEMPYDRQYEDAYGFVLDVVPQYLHEGPSEAYIREKVFTMFPENMKKGERKKAIKAKIKELFQYEKSYPHWQYVHSDWPFGKDGLPAVFVRQRTDEQHCTAFIFRDRSDGAEITVTQQRGW